VLAEIQVPDEYREALAALESLADEQLWQIEGATLPEAQFHQFTELRGKSHHVGLTGPEQEILDQLMAATDLHVLKKAYAAVLLTQRGYRLPALVALESA
jgi:hypothetical protein